MSHPELACALTPRIARRTAGLLLLAACFGGSPDAAAQELYYPPTDTDDWATVSAAEAGFSERGLDALDSLLEATNTHAFLLLRDGRIVREHYYGDFGRDSLWLWNSAGKTMTAALIGIAQAAGELDVAHATSDYLGRGWTAMTPAREDAITIRHQLTMTTGLDDTAVDVGCTHPSCLTYLAEPGTRWSYHNGPYTLLLDVLQAATGQAPNAYVRRRLTPATGIRGGYLSLDSNRIFVSRPRDMARFGLLVLGGGAWDGTPVLADTAYLRAATTPSQALNPAYGYLWWLNGQDSYLLPQGQLRFDGAIAPRGRADAYFGIGKDAQVVAVHPGTREVWIRMGGRPNDRGLFVPTDYVDDLAAAIEAARVTSSSVEPVAAAEDFRAWVADGRLHVRGAAGLTDLRLVDGLGRVRALGNVNGGSVGVGELSSGLYWVVGVERGGVVRRVGVVW